MSLVLPFHVADIQGWTLPNELRFLYSEAVRLESLGIRGRLLEVGCWLGRSTAALAQAGDVDVVDTFRGSYEIEPRHRVADQLVTFVENMTALGLQHRVHPYEGMSADWLPALPGPYRLIFIDGAHDYPTVRSDLIESQRLLTPGGALVIDDLCPEFPGVQRAVREVLHNDLEQSVGKMGVWRAR